MKSTPVSLGLSTQRQSRWSRLLVATAALALGATAWAQNAVSTYSGTVGTPGFSNTSPITYRFTNPSGAVVDSSGNVFVADAANNVIRRIATNGTVTTFAGSATGVAG